MKINWFSPLPPTRSEVARQTVAFLPHLSSRAEITVWSSRNGWDSAAEKYAVVRHYDAAAPPWREIGKADVTFYQMGNDPRYHAGIWKMSRQHPGVVILHDLKLQHLFAGLMIEEPALSRREYLALVQQHHGATGRFLAESYLNGVVGFDQLAEECPLTGAAIDRALAVIVHSETAYQALSKEFSTPIAYLPLCAAIPPLANGTIAKAAGTRAHPYRIILFGFLGPNRRLPMVLQALARFPGRERFRLDVYGTMEGEEKIAQLICRLGLMESVTLHGFVPEEELINALRGSDLAVNLRYPSMGEASASQLQLWQYALPSLVTRTAWYATLSEGTVAFVRADHEIEDIQAHLAGFLKDPEKYRALGRNGQQYVNDHCGTQTYVDGLMEMANRVSEFHAVWTARALSLRVGSAMGGWGEAASQSLSEGAAREIQALVRALPPRFVAMA